MTEAAQPWASAAASPRASEIRRETSWDSRKSSAKRMDAKAAPKKAKV